MLTAERGATGGDRGRDTGEMTGHHVRITLDDDDLIPPRDLTPGKIRPVEEVGLLEQRGLGRVEVLRAGVVGGETAGAEADHIPGEVADRPHQPPVEPVDEAAATALFGQAAEDELRGGEVPAHEMSGETVPAGRRVADTEAGGRVPVETPSGEEVPSVAGVGGTQPLGVEVGGRPVRVEQSLALTGDRPTGHPTALVGERDTGATGEAFHRLREGQSVDGPHEGDHVTADAAPEAVIGTDLRPDVERRCLLVVERAQAPQLTAADRTQLHVVADNVLDGRAFTHGSDVRVADASGHTSLPASQAERQRAGVMRGIPPHRPAADPPSTRDGTCHPRRRADLPYHTAYAPTVQDRRTRPPAPDHNQKPTGTGAPSQNRRPWPAGQLGVAPSGTGVGEAGDLVDDNP